MPWPRRLPGNVLAGVYRGLCHHMGFGSYVAGAAEISVTVMMKKIKVHRIVAATDPGVAVKSRQI